MALADCINWPKLMSQYEVNRLERGKQVIVLQDFEDFTKLPGDDWLRVGIPYALKDFINTAYYIDAVYGHVATYSPLAGKPSYTITGMFQHTKDNLRVFVQLMRSGELLKQFQLDIKYPNKQFFDTIGDTALQIMAVVSPKYERELYEHVRTLTSNISAYESFIRGMIAYWQYNPDAADIAKTWFEESKKADVNYVNAYKGMIDLYTFLAMYNKQNRTAFGNYFQLAEKELVLMKKFSRRPPLPERPKKIMIKMKEKWEPLDNRFLLGNSAYIAGFDAFGQKKYSEAVRYFEESLTYVPEDAMTWLYLAQAREMSGNGRGAAEARAKAFGLNSCLQ